MDALYDNIPNTEGVDSLGKVLDGIGKVLNGHKKVVNGIRKLLDSRGSMVTLP